MHAERENSSDAKLDFAIRLKRRLCRRSRHRRRRTTKSGRTDRIRHFPNAIHHALRAPGLFIKLQMNVQGFTRDRRVDRYPPGKSIMRAVWIAACCIVSS